MPTRFDPYARIAEIAGRMAATSATQCRVKHPMSQSSQGLQADGSSLSMAYYPSSGQVWFIPEQPLVTLPSSDEFELGNTSVGKFGKADAGVTKVNVEKAAKASRAKCDFSAVSMENLQSIKMQQ